MVQFISSPVTTLFFSGLPSFKLMTLRNSRVEEALLSKGVSVAMKQTLLPGPFPDKVTPDIVFADEAVAQCDIPVTRIPFVGAGNLQMITNKF